MPHTWRLSGFYFFYFAFVGVSSPYFAQYLQTLGFRAFEIALLISQMQLMRIVAPNVWGWLADHGGSRLSIIRLTAAMAALSVTGFYFIGGFWAWWGVLGVMGFFWSASLPLFEALTLDRLKQSGGDYSRVRLWGSVGFIVAVAGAGWLLDRLPIEHIRAMMLAMLIGILGFALLASDPPLPHASGGRVTLWPVLRSRKVATLLLACFTMSAAHGAFYLFFSIYLAGHGYSQTAIGILWSVGVLAEIGVFLFGGPYLRRYSTRAILLACFVSAALRFSVTALAPENIWLIVFAQALHALSFGAYHSTAIQAVQRWFPVGCQGRGQALYSSLSFGAGGLLGGLLAGAIWEGGGGGTAYLVSAAIAILGGLLVTIGIGVEDDVESTARGPETLVLDDN